MPSTYTWAFDLRDDTRAVLAHGLPGAEPVRLGTEALDGSAWSTLRSQVRQHRLEGLLVAAVADAAIATTAAQRAEMAQAEVTLTLARMWQEQRFTEVIDGL